STSCAPIVRDDTTAQLVLDQAKALYRYRPEVDVTRDTQHIQTFEPQLTPLQQQLLDLLDVPASAYLTAPPH
ncbi:MAG: hypothetical protein ACRDKL_09760, partial [Solirubrobacteraceae bacterium]